MEIGLTGAAGVEETAADGAANGTAGPLPPPGEKRRLDLHRRRAIIMANRIDVRPSRAAIVPPLAGFLFGALCVALIVLGVVSDAIPYYVLAILLLCALLAVPLSGITLVYALVGANVIFDRTKQSGAWQQGFLGMGIGTTELVPFWKIAEILVTRAGEPGATLARPAEEFAQWEAVVVKQSGARVPIAGMTVPRQFERAGFSEVHELAVAVAALTAAPLRIEAPAPAPTSALPPVPDGETGASRRAVRTHSPRPTPTRRRKVRRP